MTALEKKQFDIKILKKCSISFWLCLSVVLGLALSKLIYSNRWANLGRQLEQIEEETVAVRMENDRLRLELDTKQGGLEQLKETALNAGYTEKPQYLYLEKSDNVAQKMP